MTFYRNIEAERILLSRALLSKSIPPGIQDIYFCDEEKKLYQAIVDEIKIHKEVDPVLLRTKFPEVVEKCFEYQGSFSDHTIYELREAATKREISRKICDLDLSGSCDEISKKISTFQKELSAILTSRNKDYDQKNTTYKLIEELEKVQTSSRRLRGYSTGLKSLDDCISGIEKGKVYAIGALKKTGKSRFGIFLTCMLHNVDAGVMWNSLEMSEIELNLCVLSHISGISTSKLCTTLKEDDYTNLKKSIQCLNYFNWCIYKEHTAYDLHARILSEKNKRSVDVIIVDFIQRMRCDKYKSDRVREVEAIAQDLADIARDLNVAIIEFSQLSGSAEKLEDDEIPNMSHFKESQAIPENSDVNIILHCKNRHESPFNNENKYVPRKFGVRVEQRYGISNAIIELNADLRTCEFTDEYSNIDRTTNARINP